MTVSKMILARDINGYVTFGLTPSALKRSAILENGINASFTVPTSFNTWQIVFSFESGSNVWVAYDEVAQSPAGNTFASTTSELNPTVRQVAGGTVIDCLTTDTQASVQVSLYAL